jgi:hypothetical protein
MRPRSQLIEPVQDALGIATIGDGYILRNDGVAVGLAELTPPDLHLHDEHSLAALLDAYEAVLRASGERMILCSYAVPPDLRPLLTTLTAAQQRAADFISFTVLNALTDFLALTLRVLATIPTVRWVLAVPSVMPELPPRGTWGELSPAALIGQSQKLRGDPVLEALTRTRRLVGALAALGTEPPPRLLSAAEITSLLALALDPIRAQAHPASLLMSHARPLQTTEPEPSTPATTSPRN